MGEFEGSDEMFLANKVWATGEYLGDESHAEDMLEMAGQERASLEEKRKAVVHELESPCAEHCAIRGARRHERNGAHAEVAGPPLLRRR